MTSISKFGALAAMAGLFFLGNATAESPASREALPKIGFFSEEFRYGEAWRRFGLYEALRENGFLGNATPSMSWIFGNVSGAAVDTGAKTITAFPASPLSQIAVGVLRAGGTLVRIH